MTGPYHATSSEGSSSGTSRRSVRRGGPHDVVAAHAPVERLAANAPAYEAAAVLGTGIAAAEAVPAALFAFTRHIDSFTDAVTQAVQLGRDTDTIAAMTGALAAPSTASPRSLCHGAPAWRYRNGSSPSRTSCSRPQPDSAPVSRHHDHVRRIGTWQAIHQQDRDHRSPAATPAA